LEKHGGVEDVYFYAFTILTSDDFNCLGKALPKEAQMDTRAIDENETWKIGLQNSWQNERKEPGQKVAESCKKIRAQGGDATDNVSGITPSISSTCALLSSTLSARLGEFNAIE
jgi:hypothetical protein